MNVEILGRDAEVLRQVAEEVPLHDITSPRIKNILEKMKIALDSQDDGVAIAAPQIGVALRIFIVSGRVIGYIKGEENHDEINEAICKRRRRTGSCGIFFVTRVFGIGRHCCR